MASYRVYVCQGESCKRRGAQAVWQALRREVAAQGAQETADLIVGGCQGRCDFGPNLIVHPGATKYSGATAEIAPVIVRSHLLSGSVVDDLLFREW
jgi:(2Fe-2S) ferredoxin